MPLDFIIVTLPFGILYDDAFIEAAKHRGKALQFAAALPVFSFRSLMSAPKSRALSGVTLRNLLLALQLMFELLTAAQPAMYATK